MQIGLSLLLLIGAGLFVQTLRNLKSLNVGFTTDHLLTFGIDPTLGGYDPKEALLVQKQLLETLATQPGVRSVAGTDDPVLTGDNSSSNVSFAVTATSPMKTFMSEWSAVTPVTSQPWIFRLLAGRMFTDQDLDGKSKVAIVNASLARKYFGEPKNAVGQLMASR